MNNPQQPGMSPYGHGAYPPPPSQAPRPGSGRTLLWLAAGLVVVLLAVGAVALLVLGDDSDESPGEGTSNARDESCAVYSESMLNVETWAAVGNDPDRMQELYDALAEDITDDEIRALVAAEAEAMVAQKRGIQEWKASMEEALERGEHPDTTLPDGLGADSPAPKAQAAVINACASALGADDDAPVPQVTAPTLDLPSGLGDE